MSHIGADLLLLNFSGEKMNTEIENYLLHLSNDYKTRYVGITESAWVQEMNKQFDESLRLIDGKSYIKVCVNTSVHTFIVKEDGIKFKKGDILKAASWKSPATNFSRGNLFNPESFKNVSWAGA